MCNLNEAVSLAKEALDLLAPMVEKERQQNPSQSKSELNNQEFTITLELPMYAVDGASVDPSSITWEFTRRDLNDIDKKLQHVSQVAGIHHVEFRQPGGKFYWDSPDAESLSAALGLHGYISSDRQFFLRISTDNDEESVLTPKVSIQSLYKVLEACEHPSVNTVTYDEVGDEFVIETVQASYYLDPLSAGETAVTDHVVSERPGMK